MKMKKSKYIILSVLSAMALTSCSLFNDDDIKVENHFSPKQDSTSIVVYEEKIGDVNAIKVEDVPTSLVFKNVPYSNLPDGKIENTYKEGGANYSWYNVNGGDDYDVDKNNNNFDLYVPEEAVKGEDQNVVLFIHGGAWISGLKTDVNPYVKLFANKGYISATIEYTLLSKEMNDSALSVFRNLDEIDACVKTIKESLIDLGYTGKLNLVIGGASSGAHLAMLYSYSRKSTYPMDIKFIVDAVGPTDIQEYAWKEFVNAEDRHQASALRNGSEQQGTGHLKTLPVAGQGYDWNEYQTMRIANGMCGLPFALSEVEASTSDEINVTDHSSDLYKKIVSNSNSGEKLLSVTHYITSANKIPMLCGYAGDDKVVGISQFANLEKAMTSNSYVENTDYKFFYFENCGHVNLDTDQATYEAFSNAILNWLENK